MATASALTSTTPESFRKEITNVNEEYFARLIGKSGSLLKEIKSQFKPESNLNIIFNSEKSMIVLTANDRQTVEKCEQIFQLLIREHKTREKLNKSSVLRSFCKLNNPSMTTFIDPYNNNEEIYSYSLYMPEKHKGKVIGTHGKNLKSISDRYENVSIKIDDDDDIYNRTPNVFVISDNPKTCKSAYNRLREFCDSVSGHKKKGNTARISENLE